MVGRRTQPEFQRAKKRRICSNFVRSSRAEQGFSNIDLNYVPSCILSHIFKLAFDEITQNRVPAAVIRVCKSWYDIAVSTPELWTRIVISDPRHIPLLGNILQRSESSTFDLRLNLLDQAWDNILFTLGDSSGQRWWMMIDILKKHLSRCKRLYICLNDPIADAFHLLEGDFSLWPTPLPHLEELLIEKTEPFYYSFQPLQIFPQGLPALRTVKMGSFVVLPADAYEQLTSLYICAGAMSFQQFYETLSKCTSLRTLAIYGEFCNFLGTFAALPLINLRFLSTVRFFDVTEWFISFFLRTISTSQLQDLVLSRFRLSKTENLAVPPVVAQRYPNVTKLTLTLAGKTLKVKETVRITAVGFPKVEEITFLGAQFKIGLDVLQENVQGQIAFPNLRSIAIVSVYYTRWEKFFQARKNARVKLVKVQLSELAHRNTGQGWLEWLSKQVKVEVDEGWRNIENECLWYPFHVQVS